MKTTFTTKIAALNIAAHRHTNSDTYERILSDAFSIRQPIKLRGDRHALLRSISPYTESGKIVGFGGSIVTFIDIDKNDKWYNLSKSKEADDSEVQEQIAIPENLKLKPKFFDFYFDLMSHTFAFTKDNRGNSLSPLTLKSYFDQLFQHPAFSRYESIEVTVIQEPETLEKIWRLLKINKLEIYVARPNSPGDVERAIYKKLEDNHAQDMQTTYRHNAGESLQPTEQVKQESKVALKNGFVKASGRDVHNKPVTLSTEQHPTILPAEYKSGQNLSDLIRSIVSKFTE